jgi:putative tryptophan/tyrosine transport system substrate-binding protein
MIVIPTTLNALQRNRIISSAARGGLPAMYAFRFYATDGGLMSYGIDTVDLFRRSASYVDRRGAGAITRRSHRGARRSRFPLSI